MSIAPKEDWETDLANLTLENKRNMQSSSPVKPNTTSPSSLRSGSITPSNNSPKDRKSASPKTMIENGANYKIASESSQDMKRKPQEDGEPKKGTWMEACQDGLQVYVLIEDRYCGGLIGRAGASIDKIRSTGAMICLQDRRLKFQNHLPKRALKIRGDEDSIKKAIIATAKRLVEVKAANIAYKNGEPAPAASANPTYEISILSPEGLLNEEFRSHSHVVVEQQNTWELIDIWGNEDRISTLCIRILNESGLGNASIDESKLVTAITKKNRNGSDRRNNNNNNNNNRHGNNNGYNNRNNNYNRNNDNNNGGNNYQNNRNNNNGRRNNRYNNNNNNNGNNYRNNRYNNNNNNDYGNNRDNNYGRSNGNNYNNRNNHNNNNYSNNNSGQRNNNSNYNNERNSYNNRGNNNNNNQNAANNNGQNQAANNTGGQNNNYSNNQNYNNQYSSSSYKNGQQNAQNGQYSSGNYSNSNNYQNKSSGYAENTGNNGMNTAAAASTTASTAAATNNTGYGYDANTQEDVWSKQNSRESWQIENNQYSSYAAAPGATQNQANTGVSTYFTGDVGKYYGSSPNITTGGGHGAMLNQSDIWEDV